MIEFYSGTNTNFHVWHWFHTGKEHYNSMGIGSDYQLA